MARIATKDYPREYEDLLARALLYFDISERTVNNVSQPRRLYEFLSVYTKERGISSFPQPPIVSRLLDRLVDHGLLSKARSGGMDGADNDYLCVQKADFLNVLRNQTAPSYLEIARHLNMAAYGFPLILEYFRAIALPIEFSGIDPSSRQEFKSLGTCLWTHLGIVTAKHCVQGARRLAIKGLSGYDLRKGKVLLAANSNLDLALIQPPVSIARPNPMPSFAEADLLEEVLAIGFPNVPGYHNFCAAEKRTSRLALPGVAELQRQPVWTSGSMKICS